MHREREREKESNERESSVRVKRAMRERIMRVRESNDKKQ